MRLHCVATAARAINYREHSADWHVHVLEASRTCSNGGHNPANVPGFDVILDMVRCRCLSASVLSATSRWTRPLHAAVLVLVGLTPIHRFASLNDSHRCAAVITCSGIWIYSK